MPRLLIVDDERALGDTLKDIFEDKGFHVTLAFSASEALQKIHAGSFDVGFIDWKLPDENGLTVLHDFKNHFPDSVCIIITGYATLQNVLGAMRDGADGYFIKPLNIDAVLHTVQSAFEKRRLLREILESEERYRIITENSSDMIIIVRTDGIIEYTNSEALQRVLGYNQSDIIGHSILKLVPDDDRKKITHLLERECDARRTMKELRLFDVKGDNNQWFEVMGQKYKGKDGSEKILLTCHETTARKKYEALLERENERLQELTSMQDDFVYNATHELRTPLSLVSGAVEYLRAFEANLPADTSRLFDFISRGSDRLKELVETLVNFSDANAERLEVRPMIGDLVLVLNKVIAELHEQIRLSNAKIVLDVPDKLVCEFDSTRLYQVMKQLVINAIKNSPVGGTIEVRLSINGPVVVFKIKDNGIGFTPDERAQVFRKFGKVVRKQSDYHINIQGFGLGLFIAKKIIEKHNGSINLESGGRNMGSTLTFAIPYLRKGEENKSA